MNIIVGFIFVGVGAVITIKHEKVLHAFGRMEWAESKLGMWGGTRTMIRLIGLAVILLGFLVITNLLEPIGRGITRLFFGI